MTDDSANRGGQDYESSLAESDKSVASFARTHTPIETLQHVLHGNPTLVPVIVLIAATIIFGLVAGERFFSAFNLTLIMQQVSIIGILAAAQTLIILSAGIDLSVAAIMVLMAVIAGKLSVDLGVPAPISVLVALAGGAAAGGAGDPDLRERPRRRRARDRARRAVSQGDRGRCLAGPASAVLH